MLRAQEGERERLAMDLHDGLGAKISALRLEYEVLSGKINAQFAEKNRHIQHLIDEIRQDVRMISKNLVPYDLEKSGLVYEIDKLQYHVENTYPLKFLVHFVNMDERLPYLAELNIFRIIQELVNNTIKHAEATEISLNMIRDEHVLQFSYADNGKGMDANQKKEGIGLSNIKTRAEHLHGEVTFGKNGESGFYARIIIPLENLPHL